MSMHPLLWTSSLLGVVTIVTACSGDATDFERAAPLPDIAPFEALAGLRLPSTVSAVAKARPQAQLTSYGLEERIGELTIKYFADRPPGSEDPAPPKARVEGIDADWGLVSDDAAASVWRSSLDGLNLALGQSPECLRASASVVFARWRTRNSSVAFVRLQRSVTSPVPESATIQVGFSVDTTILIPALSDAVPTPCDKPFSS